MNRARAGAARAVRTITTPEVSAIAGRAGGVLAAAAGGERVTVHHHARNGGTDD